MLSFFARPRRRRQEAQRVIEAQRIALFGVHRLVLPSLLADGPSLNVPMRVYLDPRQWKRYVVMTVGMN